MNKIHLAFDAQEDLRDIQTYIAQELENPQAARTVTKRITSCIRDLKTHAYLGAPLSSIANVEEDYRFLVSGSYLIFYRVMGSDVYVDRILYGRRDYLSVLLK